MQPLAPDMASLSVGANHFLTRVYENSPDRVAWLASEMRTHKVDPEIKAFDPDHMLQAKLMHNRGEIEETPYVQFVMGVKNAMPADRPVFEFYVETVRRLFGREARWCAAGIGRHQAELSEWSAELGGHLRTGLEDNIRPVRDTLAPSNAALVGHAARAAERHGRRVSTPGEARAFLGLAHA